MGRHLLKYLLFLVTMGLVGLGCYEYTGLLLKNATDQRHRNDLEGRLNVFQARNKDREKEDAEFGNDIVALGKRILATKNALAKVKEQAVDVAEARKAALIAKSGPAGKPTAPKGPPPSNDLGTITTADGRTFEDCHLIMVESGSIVFTHSDGIMDLPYPQMKSELQKRFGYDPKKGPSLPDDQVQIEEAQRQAADQLDGSDLN